MKSRNSLEKFGHSALQKWSMKIIHSGRLEMLKLLSVYVCVTLEDIGYGRRTWSSLPIFIPRPCKIAEKQVLHLKNVGGKI